MAVRVLKQNRLYDFARWYIYGGKSITLLKKKLGLEYKKGKSDKDVNQIVRNAYSAGLDTNTLLNTVAQELDTVFNNA